MSDFLARLVDRALGIASPVQPLVRSRFAPGLNAPGRALPAAGDRPADARPPQPASGFPELPPWGAPSEAYGLEEVDEWNELEPFGSASGRRPARVASRPSTAPPAGLSERSPRPRGEPSAGVTASVAGGDVPATRPAESVALPAMAEGAGSPVLEVSRVAEPPGLLRRSGLRQAEADGTIPAGSAAPGMVQRALPDTGRPVPPTGQPAPPERLDRTANPGESGFGREAPAPEPDARAGLRGRPGARVAALRSADMGTTTELVEAEAVRAWRESGAQAIEPGRPSGGVPVASAASGRRMPAAEAEPPAVFAQTDSRERDAGPARALRSAAQRWPGDVAPRGSEPPVPGDMPESAPGSSHTPGERRRDLRDLGALRRPGTPPQPPVAPAPLAARPPAAPAIRVTIGRVEIQALLPPAPPAEPPPSWEPRVSLEEYLRARSEARR